MRTFAEAGPDEAIVQQPVARILDHFKDRPEREWYARAVLPTRLESGCRFTANSKQSAPPSGSRHHHFERTLPAPQSDLAQQITKDPYTFDFLMLSDDAHERELEQGLLRHLLNFLLELGVGSLSSVANIGWR
jgi:hypothetical protein